MMVCLEITGARTAEHGEALAAPALCRSIRPMVQSGHHCNGESAAAPAAKPTLVVIAAGTGVGSRRAPGTAVFGGMISGTLPTVVFVPVFFVLIRKVKTATGYTQAVEMKSDHGMNDR